MARVHYLIELDESKGVLSSQVLIYMDDTISHLSGAETRSITLVGLGRDLLPGLGGRGGASSAPGEDCL